MSDKPTRRAALKVVAGTAVSLPIALEAVDAARHPPVFPLTHDCDLELLELRRAIDAFQAAVRYEMSIEGEPGHAAAVAESDARQAVIEALVEAIHERTPTSMRDVALRAEALRQYFFAGPVEMLAEVGCGGQDYALAKLYEAVVLVTGGSDV